jgi:hypothetical protein
VFTLPFDGKTLRLRSLPSYNAAACEVPMHFSIHLHRRFSVQAVATIAILFFMHITAHAGLCMPPVVEKDSTYQYILTLADAMGYAKSALDRVPKYTKSQSSDYDLLLGLKLGQADFECAASHVSPYASSSTETIQVSAQAAALVFTSIVELREKSIAQYTTILNSTDGREIERGTALEKLADLGAAYDETWKLLIPAALAATHSVVEEDTTTGRMSRLALTATQRDEILQNLRFTFGEEITKGMKAGQISLVAAAAVLYHVIGNQNRKTRDSK